MFQAGKGRAVRKIVINALQYKKNSSGIGVLIRELFSPFTRMTAHPCEIVLCRDAESFPAEEKTARFYAPCGYAQGARRMVYQLFQMGRRCRNAVLLTTDAKTPFFLPKSCDVLPIVTDLGLYRHPETYPAERVLLWKMQYRYLRRRARRFAAISEFTKRELTDILHIPPEKIDVIPCACGAHFHRVTDAAQLNALCRRYALPERYALFVGNANPRKNLERLLRAFDAAKEQGLTQHLVIAGGAGWKFDGNKALSGLRHKESVHFLGFVPDEDMPALYSAADAFLFPTLYEGFGIPVLEAQRCGTPVLTSRTSALPEVGGSGALYVDPFDTEDMTRGIVRLLTDGALAASLAEAGHRNAGRFSWRASAEALDDIIERYYNDIPNQNNNTSK